MAAKTFLKTTLVILLFSVVLDISGMAQGKNIYVGDDGSANFTNIQAAINAAVDGDTVIVANENYTGFGNRDIDNDGIGDICESTPLFDIPVTYPVGYSPYENDAYGLAIGDVNNDGLNDVVVANNHENNMGVFIQDNNGNLKQMERYATGSGSRSAAVGDINNDGLNDIVILNYWSDDITVFLQAEDGKIGEPVNYDAGFHPYRVIIGDVSNDDLPDVVVIEQAAGGLSHINIFKQNNNGLLDPKISYEAGNHGQGLAVGDINNDGLNDIVASAGRSLYVFLQESDGGFERIEYPVYDYNPEDDDYDAEIENIAIGDVNNDNLNDIVTCSFDQMSIYYQNQEAGLNSPVGYPSCRDAAIGDINNDTLNDIVSVKWGVLDGGNIRVFLQQDNSQFHQMEYTFGLNLRNVEINDLNNDGLNDVAVVDDNTNELGVFLQLRIGTNPIADAGSDQTVYAWIDGIAEITLDGTGSCDHGGRPLTYFWSWIVDCNTFIVTEAVNIIELPVGEYVVELIVNNGINDSESGRIIITVVEPMESHLSVLPRTIHRKSQKKRILASVRLPEGVTEDQIDNDQQLLLYPGGSEATVQYIRSHGHGAEQVTMFALFDKAKLIEAVADNGEVELQVVGQLKTGRYFYGSDTVKITN